MRLAAYYSCVAGYRTIGFMGVRILKNMQTNSGEKRIALLHSQFRYLLRVRGTRLDAASWRPKMEPPSPVHSGAANTHRLGVLVIVRVSIRPGDREARRSVPAVDFQTRLAVQPYHASDEIRHVIMDVVIVKSKRIHRANRCVTYVVIQVRVTCRIAERVGLHPPP